MHTPRFESLDGVLVAPEDGVRGLLHQHSPRPTTPRNRTGEAEQELGQVPGFVSIEQTGQSSFLENPNKVSGVTLIRSYTSTLEKPSKISLFDLPARQPPSPYFGTDFSPSAPVGRLRLVGSGRIPGFDRRRASVSWKPDHFFQ